jgi:hypothetical protein
VAEVAAPHAAAAGPVAVEVFSPFPVLFVTPGRSRVRYRVAWRVLIQSPQPTRSRRPTAALLL